MWERFLEGKTLMLIHAADRGTSWRKDLRTPSPIPFKTEALEAGIFLFLFKMKCQAVPKHRERRALGKLAGSKQQPELKISDWICSDCCSSPTPNITTNHTKAGFFQPTEASLWRLQLMKNFQHKPTHSWSPRLSMEGGIHLTQIRCQRTSCKHRLAKRKANLCLSLVPMIFKTGTFRGQSISSSWLCRHPGARSLNVDVWSKGRRIPPSQLWMQAVFILRKAIDARMCLSHPCNVLRPLLKFFPLRLPKVLADLQPAHTSHLKDLLLPDAHSPLYQHKPPAARAEHQEVMVGFVLLFQKYFYVRCQLQNHKKRLCSTVTWGIRTRKQEQTLTDIQFWSTLLTTADAFLLAEV